MDTQIANDVRAEPTRRFSAQRKLEAVGRLMRGESLELVARECPLSPNTTTTAMTKA